MSGGSSDRPMTRVVHAGRDPEAWNGAVNPPLYRVSTVIQASMADRKAAFAERAADGKRMVYGRTGTPTTRALEDALCELEGGHRAQLYPSGLSAIASAVTAFVAAGDTILMTDNAYGPTRTFCDTYLRRMGVKTVYFDPRLGADIARLMTPDVKLVFLESPGSLTFEVADVPAIARAAKAAAATVMIDNTWATPLFFQPLAHGVDVSIHAGTKYIAGHSDAMLGIAIANEESWPRLRDGARQTGICVGADEAYLTQRGLRTMAVRLRQHQETTFAVATWLAARDDVASVLYPALPESPDHALWRRDFTGACGLMAFELATKSADCAAAIVDRLRLFGIGSSWGGYESLAIAADPAAYRTATRWQGRGALIRLHVGLEDPADLIADLDTAMEAG